MSIQYKIDKLLEAKNLDKTKVSKILGVSRNTVYNLTENTSIVTYKKLCDLLNITLNDLFSENDINNLLKKSKNDILKEPPAEYKTAVISDYKEKYLETLEKLNICNERLLIYTQQELKKQKK